MPKLPSIKAKKLIKILQKFGFIIHHQKGSHIQLKHLDGRRTTVPFHTKADIKRGTLSGILKDIDIDVEDFLKK